MSIEDGLARLMMSGHGNAAVFREQIERARNLKRMAESAVQTKPGEPQNAGRDRSGEFQPVARPSIVRTIANVK